MPGLSKRLTGFNPQGGQGWRALSPGLAPQARDGYCERLLRRKQARRQQGAGSLGRKYPRGRYGWRRPSVYLKRAQGLAMPPGGGLAEVFLAYVGRESGPFQGLCKAPGALQPLKRHLRLTLPPRDPGKGPMITYSKICTVIIKINREENIGWIKSSWGED